MRASFWYRCELQTPNSLRERTDERWNFRFEKSLPSKSLHHLHFLYISFTFPLWCNISLLRKILLRGSIFHRTVLEGYWEFGARIGTKMKLAVSTFSSFRLFLFSKTTTLLNFWKQSVMIKFRSKTQVWLVEFFREFRMGIGPPHHTHRNMGHMIFPGTRIEQFCTELWLYTIWWTSEKYLMCLAKK